MMFSQNFVAIIRDATGKVLRESKEKEVFLPFNSHYSIRLKNNNSRKSVAEINIDGTDILSSHKIIVPANSSVDVDRFCLDGNLGKGRKLQFVRLSDSRVQDPTSDENGIVRIRFWIEKPVTITYNPNFVNIPWNTHIIDPYRGPYWKYQPSIYCSSGNNIVRTAQVNYSCNVSTSEKGATVEGSESNQGFSLSEIGELESNYTELVLKLRAASNPVTVQDTKHKFCSNCGFKTRTKNKFCSECGTKF